MPGGTAGWGETGQELGIHIDVISLGGLLGFYFLVYV